MNVEYLETLSYDELRALYREFLYNCSYKQNTVNTSYGDTFYLWRNGGKDLFWKTVTDDNFEENIKAVMLKCLEKNSKGDIKKTVNNYVSHLRQFRLFVDLYDETREVKGKSKSKKTDSRKDEINVPTPCNNEVELYLKKWRNSENYRIQEDSLNKLFLNLVPNNVDILDILLKVSTLNDFYSTNIYSTYPVAKHIKSLNIDERLKVGDVSLVDDLQLVEINGKTRRFYSFATKYCSHHKPFDYPIYDSYVDKILCYFRNKDGFAYFKNDELKNYERFKDLIIEFRKFYGLDKYNLKEIDQYLWQLGKKYFPKNYKK